MVRGSVKPKSEHQFVNSKQENRENCSWSGSIAGALSVADLVRGTLGPKGMDKILLSTNCGGTISVTNDGATILKSIYVESPTAKILIDASKVQDDEVGDGTTSVVVLAGELLREAEQLVKQKLHPITIVAGFRESCEVGLQQLESIAFTNRDNPITFQRDLVNTVKTTLASKILTHVKDHFADLAVKAVLRLQGSGELDMIQIIKKVGGTLRDSFLDEGFILDKKIGVGQPRRLENVTILLANTPMDTDKIKIYGTQVKSNSIMGIAEIEAAEKANMKTKCDKILSHGINCFINRQLIYNYPEQIFTANGLISIEHADFDGVERLAKALGSEIVSTFDTPAEVKLGKCRSIDEIMIGESKLIRFNGVERGNACTIVLRGASPHLLDEAERSLHDALCVLASIIQDSHVIYGGGCAEMQMACKIDEVASRLSGKQSLAMHSFARALCQIPFIICDNAGLDSTEVLAALRASHRRSECSTGVDVAQGGLGDMKVLGILEAFKVKHQTVLSATDAAESILRVDQIIRNTPRRREH